MLYTDVFSRPQSLFVVVHIANTNQVLRNARIAMECGAHGVFLIDHGGNREIGMAAEVNNILASAWIGVNRLGASDPFDGLPEYVRGVWTDDACIEEHGSVQTAAEALRQERTASGWDGLYFGGVAFKYRRPVSELETAVKVAAPYMDVICTSGPGTGLAADPEKIRRMCSAATKPVAIASGITPDNVSEYPGAACFLAATGISKSFHELDPAKVTALVRGLRS